MILLENVTKIFGGSYPEALRLMEEGRSSDEIREQTGSTVAVREINLQIQKEKITVIMGLSGSGKSTLKCRHFVPTAFGRKWVQKRFFNVTRPLIIIESFFQQRYYPMHGTLERFNHYR
jgi:ABC-type ATPase with predicted acetyltransferase domain